MPSRFTDLDETVRPPPWFLRSSPQANSDIYGTRLTRNAMGPQHEASCGRQPNEV
jgi:hypothetical protein